MTSNPKAGRRSFLKYVGGGLVAGAAAGAGYYLYGREREYSPAQIATTYVSSSSACPTPHPSQPLIVPDIQVKPRYINPTTEDPIEFSYCLHGPVPTAPLLVTWTVDSKEVSHEPQCASKLSQGDHAIVLKVSDAESETVTSTTVTVEPDQMYPTKPLRVKYKGVNYCVGKPMTPEFPYPTPNRDQMDEELDNIHNDLGCNAIIIIAGADSEDDLVECARIALQKGFFDRIYMLPHYFRHSPDETVERIAKFAPRVRRLRESSEAIHFMVGKEFSLISDIIPGDTWHDRVEYQVGHHDWVDRVWATFPRMFKDIIAVCKENYGYEISYAAISYAEIDAVPWSDPLFESVGIDGGLFPALGATEEVFLRQLSDLKGKFGKPVIIPDGPSCMTYTGADQWGGCVLPNAWENGPYDEDAQAKYIKSYCDVLDRARIEGCFYYQYRELADKGVGLYSIGKKRKKGFYMYKSYKPTG